MHGEFHKVTPLSPACILVCQQVSVHVLKCDCQKAVPQWAMTLHDVLRYYREVVAWRRCSVTVLMLG